MVKVKKIMAMAVTTGLIASMALMGGCTKDPLLDQNVQATIKQAQMEAFKAGQASVDVTVDNEQVVNQAVELALEKEKAEAEKDAMVLEDYKKELEALKTELAEKPVVDVEVSQESSDAYVN
jgi:hypothetical protein